METADESNNKIPQPMKGKCILACDMDQKDGFTMITDGGLKLWMTHNHGYDGKVTNAVLGKVISKADDVDDVNVGDYVLCHHNALNRIITGTSRLGDLGEKLDGLSLFSIEYTLMYIRITPEKEALPLKRFMMVERICDEYVGLMVIPDSAKKFDKQFFKVLKAGADCEGIAEGDTIMCYEKSDYEINYTLDYKERQVIRVDYNDVLAIKN